MYFAGKLLSLRISVQSIEYKEGTPQDARCFDYIHHALQKTRLEI